MDKEHSEDTSFLAGFNEFWDADFPKTCPKCGKIFDNFSEFVAETQKAQESSGLMEYHGDNDETTVGVFRNCSCGSTLMISGHDRRDTSESGEKRRQVFGAMLKKLVAANVPPDQARRRLLRMLYSGQIEDLAKRLLS